VRELGADLVVDRGERDAVRLAQRAVERAALGEFGGDAAVRAGQVRSLASERGAVASSHQVDPGDGVADLDAERLGDLGRGGLLADVEHVAVEARSVEIFAERGELAHRDDGRGGDEGAPALRALDAALHDELGERLAYRRARGAEALGE